MGKKYSAADLKYKEFVNEYLNNGFNATNAYMAVYKPDKRKTAESGGSRLLKKERVKQFIKDFENLDEEDKVSKEQIIKNIVSIRDKAIDSKRYAEALKANEMLSRMFGYNQPDKIETKTNVKFDFGDDLDE